MKAIITKTSQALAVISSPPLWNAHREPTHPPHTFAYSATTTINVKKHVQFNSSVELYVYRKCQKKLVETFMIERFKVHHKGHKPSLTLGRQWNPLSSCSKNKQWKIWESRFLVAWKVDRYYCYSLSNCSSLPLGHSLTPKETAGKISARKFAQSTHCNKAMRWWQQALMRCSERIISRFDGCKPHSLLFNAALGCCNQHVGNLQSIGSSNQGCCRFGAQIVRSHATLLHFFL